VNISGWLLFTTDHCNCLLVELPLHAKEYLRNNTREFRVPETDVDLYEHYQEVNKQLREAVQAHRTPSNETGNN